MFDCVTSSYTINLISYAFCLKLKINKIRIRFN